MFHSEPIVAGSGLGTGCDDEMGTQLFDFTVHGEYEKLAGQAPGPGGGE